jgi:Asp-tRNA(Asn)/Glu-tRNA(Gln) amidotransferase B subunit
MHLTIILCSSVIKIVINQKQKFNRKNYYYY